MFYIVETEEQLNLLKNLSRQGGYVDVISSHNEYHPILTSTIAVYLRPLNDSKGYIIPITHSEGINVSKDKVSHILSQYDNLYTLNKKDLLYHFNLQKAKDISLIYSMTYFDRLEPSSENLHWFYSKYQGYREVNKLIPLSKLYEDCETRFESVKPFIDLEIPSGYQFYNKIATNVFYLIEQQGLGIYYDNFKTLFKPKDPLYNIMDNVVYTSYNLYNITSRPTNAFNSVNFAAIPKEEEYRKCFRPKNDVYVEFDFDGYHLRLLCDQIDYELTDESAHIQLARQYFGKEDITEEEYTQAKQINFQAIYGKIPEEYKHLEIFQKIQDYIDNLYDVWGQLDLVCNPQSGKPFTKLLRGMHPAKLMNYMMQSLETSNNILILKDLLKYLQDKESKVALYIYDAIIIDFKKSDGKETLEEIKRILENNGKYKTKFKFSNSLVL